MIDMLQRINDFTESNTSELAREFADRLIVQLNILLNSRFDNEDEIYDYIFEHDVLLKTCDEEESDFDWDAARDLQRDMIYTVSAVALKV